MVRALVMDIAVCLLLLTCVRYPFCICRQLHASAAGRFGVRAQRQRRRRGQARHPVGAAEACEPHVS